MKTLAICLLLALCPLAHAATVSNAIPTDLFNRPAMDIEFPQTTIFATEEAGGKLGFRIVNYTVHLTHNAEPHTAKQPTVEQLSAAIASKLPPPPSPPPVIYEGEEPATVVIAHVVQPPASNRVDIAAIKSYWHQAHITDGTNAASQKSNYVYRLWMKTNLATANKTKLMDIPANGSDDTYYVSLTNTPTAFFFTQNVNLLLP